MHWHILGAGSIGCLWATALTKAGYSTRLILSSKRRLDDYNEQGFIRYEDGDQTCDISAQAELADANEPISCLLVTTKAYAVEQAVRSVAHRLTPGATVILLHNGLGPQYTIAQQFPDITVYLATTTDGAYTRAPFHIVRAGRGMTYVGQLTSGGMDSAPLPQNSPYLDIEHVDDIEHRLWCKLAINAAINPLTAIFQCKNGELLESPECLEWMERICDEVTEVAQAANQPLFSNRLIEEVKNVALATAENYSSMLQDIRHQRPTEIEQITGFICKNADDLNIAIPANQQVLLQTRNISSVS